MQASLKFKNLLIVDDEPDIGEILQWELRALSASCIIANNVPEALKLFESRPLDGIISDIRMPQLSGIDLLKTIRQHTPQVPVVLMTGFADLSLPRANDLGAEALISKPFDLEELSTTISYYSRPLLERWEVVALTPRYELNGSLVTIGRGGVLIRSSAVPFPKRNGDTVDIRCSDTKQNFRVACRWRYGDDWAGEIVAWDDATKAKGWPHLNLVPFIPLQHSN